MIKWRLAILKDLQWGCGLTRPASIRTANGHTNWHVTNFSHLEVLKQEQAVTSQ